jgi:hypothetical protein
LDRQIGTPWGGIARLGRDDVPVHFKHYPTATGRAVNPRSTCGRQILLEMLAVRRAMLNGQGTFKEWIQNPIRHEYGAGSIGVMRNAYAMVFGTRSRAMRLG